MNRLINLSTRARQIYQDEGFVSLLRRGFAFVCSYFFFYRVYYLFVCDLRNLRQLNEADLLPALQDYSIKIVTTSQEAAQLEANGCDFRSHDPGAFRMLNSGAIAFCIFSGHELASIGWAATTQSAQNAIGEQPYHVDFSNSEAYSGRFWTSPKHRHKGLATHITLILYTYLRKNGTQVGRTMAEIGNDVTMRICTNTGFNVHARGSYLRVFRWKSWRERPLSIEEQESIRQKNEPHR